MTVGLLSPTQGPFCRPCRLDQTAQEAQSDLGSALGDKDRVSPPPEIPLKLQNVCLYYQPGSILGQDTSEPHPSTGETLERYDNVSCRPDMVEILLKAAYNTIQSINQLLPA